MDTLSRADASPRSAFFCVPPDRSTPCVDALHGIHEQRKDRSVSRETDLPLMLLAVNGNLSKVGGVGWRGVRGMDAAAKPQGRFTASPIRHHPAKFTETRADAFAVAVAVASAGAGLQARHPTLNSSGHHCAHRSALPGVRGRTSCSPLAPGPGAFPACAGHSCRNRNATAQTCGLHQAPPDAAVRLVLAGGTSCVLITDPPFRAASVPRKVSRSLR